MIGTCILLRTYVIIVLNTKKNALNNSILGILIKMTTGVLSTNILLFYH